MENKKFGNKKLYLITGAVIILCAIIIAIVLASKGNSTNKKLQTQLNLGNSYMDALDYEAAIAAYEEAIKIDPKNEEAYIGLANAYIATGEYTKAVEILEEGYAQTDSADLQSKMEEVEQILESIKEAEEEAAKLAEAMDYYEKGRAALYGTEVNLEEAYINFEKAKELGNTDANFYLGLLCDWYCYPQKDYEVAKVYYETCEANPYAQISLGFLYENGQGVEEDEEKAEEIFQEVIDQGCVEGYLGMGSCAYTQKDYTTALEYFYKVLEGTEQIYIAEAMYNIGCVYHFGNGVEQDYAMALEWFEKAVDLGNSAAMNNIGYMYHFGYGVEQNYATALEWFEKAADLGNSNAMYNIGCGYECGFGVEQNYAMALEWYEKAADLGYADAMNNIGYMYEWGNGVEQNYAMALEWYEKAADLGNSAAMNNIGYMYGCGNGVEQNYAMALEWYEKAADLGNDVAMFWIGYMYEWGFGVEQNYATALEWYEKAADLGNEIAKENAEYLENILWY